MSVAMSNVSSSRANGGRSSAPGFSGRAAGLWIPFFAVLPALAASCVCSGVCKTQAAAGDAARTPPPFAASADCGAGDAFAAAVAKVPGRAVGLFHRYEFPELRDTPPPKGYRPFYISHYGRHGSRYQIDRKRSFQVVDTLESAKSAGVLTPKGEEILERLLPALKEHDGMWGMLSKLGAEEHQALAARMAKRFAPVFAGGGAVRCQSSTIQRCLASMANFSCALKGEWPDLSFSFATGDRYMQTVLHPYLKSDARGKWLREFDEKVVRDNVSPERLAALCLKDTPEARALVPDPYRFAFDLFVAACAFESLSRELGGATLDDVFSPEEWVSLGRARSCIHYAHMGNCAEFGHCASWSASDLARDIADRAEEAMERGGIRADLRFGHDSGLRPLAGFIGIEGAGDSAPGAESWKTSPTWRDMPMASNLQIILYGKPGCETLAKVLYNEREVGVRGLTAAANAVFYRWEDLARRLRSKGGMQGGCGALELAFGAGAAPAFGDAAPQLEKYGACTNADSAAVFPDMRRRPARRGQASAASPMPQETALADALAEIAAAAAGDEIATVSPGALSPGGEDPDEALRALEKILCAARTNGMAIFARPGDTPQK